MLAKGSLNIFQDSFNTILSQQLTHDRVYVTVLMVGSLLSFTGTKPPGSIQQAVFVKH